LILTSARRTIRERDRRRSRPRPAAMRIFVSDPAPIDDLVSYLRRCGCSAHVAGRDAVEAEPPERPRVDFAYLRMELDAYLRVWREMHPGVQVELLDSAQPATERRP
jgi:hypothetical protein